MVSILAIEVRNLRDYPGSIYEHCNADRPACSGGAARCVGTVLGAARSNEVSFCLKFCELCVLPNVIVKSLFAVSNKVAMCVCGSLPAMIRFQSNYFCELVRSSVTRRQ